MNNRLPKILELENKNESPSVLCALIIRENNIGLLKKIEIFNNIALPKIPASVYKIEDINKLLDHSKYLLIKNWFNELIDFENIKIDITDFDALSTDCQPVKPKNISGNSLHAALCLALALEVADKNAINTANILSIGLLDENGNIQPSAFTIEKLKAAEAYAANQIFGSSKFNVKVFLAKSAALELELKNHNFKHLDIEFVETIFEILEKCGCSKNVKSEYQKLGYYEFYENVTLKYYKNSRDFKLAKEYYEFLLAKLDRLQSKNDNRDFDQLKLNIKTKLGLCGLHKNNIESANKHLIELENFFRNNARNIEKYRLFDEYIEFINFSAIYNCDNLKFEQALDLMKSKYVKKFLDYCSLEYYLNYLNTLGQVLMYNDKFAAADKAYIKSLELCGAARKSRTLNYRAKNAFYWQNYTLAEECSMLALDYCRRERAEINNEFFAYSDLMRLYYIKKNFKKSIEYANKILADKNSAEAETQGARQSKRKAPDFLYILAHKYKALSYLRLGKYGAAVNEFCDNLNVDVRAASENGLIYLIKLTVMIEFHLFDNAMFDDGEIDELLSYSQIANEYLQKKFKLSNNFVRSAGEKQYKYTNEMLKALINAVKY